MRISISLPIGLLALTFRIVTPIAMQITTLENHSSSYPGTVYKGIPLYVKYIRSRITHKNSS